MKVHLLRHGKTMANLTYTYSGRQDLPVCDLGIEELLEKKQKCSYPDIEGIDVYTSGMTRTETTLQLLYGDIPHSIEPDFMEMDFGEFEGKTYDELKDTPAYQEWISGDHEKNKCPGGESGEEMILRVIRGMDKILKKGRDALIVCHGGVIAMLFKEYFPNSGLNWYEMQPSSGEGYTFEFEGGRPVSYNKIPTTDT